MREYLWPMKQKWTQVCTFTKIDTWIGREQNNYKVNCYTTSSLIFVTPPWTASLLSEIDFKEGDYLKKKRLLLWFPLFEEETAGRVSSEAASTSSSSSTTYTLSGPLPLPVGTPGAPLMHISLCVSTQKKDQQCGQNLRHTKHWSFYFAIF